MLNKMAFEIQLHIPVRNFTYIHYLHVIAFLGHLLPFFCAKQLEMFSQNVQTK